MMQLWTPANLPADTIVAWWDAQVASSMNIVSGAAQAWTSTVGSLTATTGSNTGRRPKLVTVNGKPCLSFSGSNYLTFTPPARNSVSDGFSIASTAGCADPYAYYPCVIGWGSGDGGGRYVFSDPEAGMVAGGVGGDGSNIITNIPFGSTLQPVVFSGVASTSKLSLTSNGSQPQTATSTPKLINSRTAGAIGRWPSFGSNWNGTIGEIIVIDKVLTDAERQQLEGYMAHRWGTQGALPVGHPYKSSPPMLSVRAKRRQVMWL